MFSTNLTLLCRSKQLEKGEDPGQSFDAQNNIFPEVKTGDITGDKENIFLSLTADDIIWINVRNQLTHF